jgi:hypothetical protein
MKRREAGGNRGVPAVFPTATVISLLLASLPGARVPADDGHSFAQEALSTTAELGGALAGSAATYAAGAELMHLGASPSVFYGGFALMPAGAAAGARLVGGWLKDRPGSYWWSVLGAYGGLVPGVLIGAGINALYPPQDLWDVTGKVAIGMYIGANIGAVVGYKLSRRPPSLDESRLRLDPPSFALSLVRGHDPESKELGSCPQPHWRPEIAEVRLNMLSVRF